MSNLICGFCNCNLSAGGNCYNCNVAYGPTLLTMSFLFSENKIKILPLRTNTSNNNRYIVYYFLDTRTARIIHIDNTNYYNTNVISFTINDLRSLKDLIKNCEKHLKYDYLS